EPTGGVLDNTLDGGLDAFVVKVSAGGSSVVYKTYLGGNGIEIGRAIAVAPNCASSCAAYVAGQSNSSSGFPTAGGLPSTPHATPQRGGWAPSGGRPAADGTGATWSGFIGGAGFDFGFGIAVDDAGDAYVAGETGSDEGSPGSGDGFPNGDGAAGLSGVLGFD